MIQRGFSQAGDVEAAFDAVARSDGLEKARLMAEGHCEVALEAVDGLKESAYKWALIEITNRVLNRKS